MSMCTKIYHFQHKNKKKWRTIAGHIKDVLESPICKDLWTAWRKHVHGVPPNEELCKKALLLNILRVLKEP